VFYYKPLDTNGLVLVAHSLLGIISASINLSVSRGFLVRLQPQQDFQFHRNLPALAGSGFTYYFSFIFLGAVMSLL